MSFFNLLLFFFHDTSTPQIYTLSLHDALPISLNQRLSSCTPLLYLYGSPNQPHALQFLRQIPDRKSTRLNSSHTVISYAVFCLKKKKKLAARQLRSSDKSPCCVARPLRT